MTYRENAVAFCRYITSVYNDENKKLTSLLQIVI